MGLFNSIRMGASGASGDYEIDRSLRFNDGDNTYLNRTPSSASNRRTWTWSGWIKRCTFGAVHDLFSAYDGSAYNIIRIGSNDQLNFQSNTAAIKLTNAKLRDPSAWYHIVVSVDTTNSTAADRVIIYINNARQTLATDNSVSQNTDYAFNTTNAHTLGVYANGSSYDFDGYMAEINFIDGFQYDPSYFGETNAITGQWNPKKYVGSYGTNGFYLKFADNSGTTATTLGKDSSGNGNNFTPNNFVTGDAVKDSPTNNFATAQMMGTPFESGAGFAEGNLKLTTGSTNSARNLNRQAFAPMLVNSGKWYAEFMHKDSSSNGFIGVGPYQQLSPTVNNTRYAYVRRNDGNAVYRTAGSETIATYGSSIAQHDVVGVYLDMDAGTPVVYFSKNGQWSDGSGNFDESNPTSGITLGDSFFTTDTGGNDGFATFILSSSDGGTSVEIQANFGQDSTFSGQITAGGNADANGKGDFKYAVPTGAKALCSANLPDPTILLPNEEFDIKLWTGNGGTQTITGLNFAPDLVWIKIRTQAYNSQLIDTVRGATLRLQSNATTEEKTNTNGLSAFTSDGYTLGDQNNVNKSGDTFVGWNWNAGGSTVTNNDGSISSQVRANPTAGFSIVTYTGTGSAGTVGHGLGVVPDTIITKGRSTSKIWTVYNKNLDNASSTSHRVIRLNQNAQQTGSSALYYGNDPTSTVQHLAAYTDSNASGENYVAYVFSGVAGYSKFGSYTGNANADGTFVYTGFRPAWVLVKGSTFAGNWNLFDNKRPGFNVTNDRLFPNLADAETDGSPTDNQIDIVSNGFKMRGSNVDTNSNGSTYVYLAFAESPFKYSRAR